MTVDPLANSAVELHELYVERIISISLLKEIEEHQKEFGNTEDLQQAMKYLQLKQVSLQLKEEELNKKLNPKPTDYIDYRQKFVDLEKEILDIKSLNQQLLKQLNKEDK